MREEPTDEDAAFRTENYELFSALGQLLDKRINALELLNRVVDIACRLVDAERGTIFVLDDEGDELVSVAAELPELEQLTVPVSKGIVGHAVRSGETLRISDVEQDTRFWDRIDAETGFATESMLVGPLEDLEGRRIGALQLLNKREGSFTPADVEAVEQFGAQLGLLLEETTLTLTGGFPADDEDATEPLVEVSRSSSAAVDEQFNGIIGDGPQMREVFQQIKQVATTDATVLLLGESGTGKSLAARAIHDNSDRADGPFVAIDCTTLPEALIENELFGHKKGAYTGAEEDAEGRVAAADGGTLFLDEIGDFPLELQGKLLTLLQDQEFTPVGGVERQSVDIRIVAATNRDLDERLDAGEFREDLYYRLSVVELQMPPLRERSEEDVRRLAEFFVEQKARKHDCEIRGLDETAMAAIQRYDWPGNVRELEHCIESAVIMSDDVLSVSDLPLATDEADSSPSESLDGDDSPSAFADEPTLSELERRYLRWLLDRYDGNRAKCARVMEVGRQTVYRKIDEYELE